MTLLDILNECPVQDLSSAEVWVIDYPAYDFKGYENGILLISQPFGNSLEIETLTLQEVVDFGKELDYSEDRIVLMCEYEMQELKSFTWKENKLVLDF